MKLYLASIPYTAKVLLANTGRPYNFLFSFYHFINEDIAELQQTYFPEGFRLFADSGAFSAWTLGLEIDIDAYIAWLHKWNRFFDCYANLDVRGDLKGTKENQRILEEAGLEPLPVYHAGEPFAYFEELIEKYDYIALGGVAGKHLRGTSLMRWLIRCFRAVEGKPVALHGFGMTAWTLLKSFPWYSVDSTSWATGNRYGTVQIFDDELGCWYSFHCSNKRKIYTYGRYLRKLGIDPKVFVEANDQAIKNRFLAIIGARSYQVAARWLTEKWAHAQIHQPTYGIGRKACD